VTRIKVTKECRVKIDKVGSGEIEEPGGC